MAQITLEASAPPAQATESDPEAAEGNDHENASVRGGRPE
ncbi:hypothetical protein WQQ_38170 [Hydrocarboniphaga effusa AP103]|uniref:Uncharacterized protein n=1 Tax=Hydrocarboniphaga effusa AP103 TaxID=1172194 RepID=I7ZAD0_9GAMM|nr:hypothetical protein WQQ_38170 [Hydrocarboniphaga effusa AP103]